MLLRDQRLRLRRDTPDSDDGLVLTVGSVELVLLVSFEISKTVFSRDVSMADGLNVPVRRVMMGKASS